MPYIKQATKTGVIWCDLGGVFDTQQPSSKTRRGRVQEHGQVCPTLQTECGVVRINGRVQHGEYEYAIRKLTPIECFRLMGWDDESFHKAEQVNSASQLYKQAGNGIVIPVLEAIFKQMFKDGKAS